MIVEVNKPVDSATYGRIVQKGEVVDLPIDGDSVLIKRGFVAATNKALTAAPPSPVGEDDDTDDEFDVEGDS